MNRADEISVDGLDVRSTIRPLAMLFGDPTTRVTLDSFERATYTPEGPGSIRIAWNKNAGAVSVEAFGDGARWLLEGASDLVGASDDASGFQPGDRVVRRLWAAYPGLKVGRTRTLWHDLAWTVVQQRVRRVDAAGQWRRLVQTYGEVAPGIDGLRLPPDPQRIARTRPSELRRLGIDLQRSRTLVEAAMTVSRLQRFVDGPFEDARRPLLSLPGIGPWTVSCLRAFTWGDPDTVIVGDSGIPSMIASVLAGERHADDARMIEILEPYRPHRYRILKLVFASRLD